MTVFDLDYAKLQESKRSNLANESIKSESNRISMRELEETISHNNAKEEQMMHQNNLIDQQAHQSYWRGEGDRIKTLPYKSVYDGANGEFFIMADYAIPFFDRAYDATVGNVGDTVSQFTKFRGSKSSQAKSATTNK